MPRILYPIWTQPVLTPEQQPEQVTESRWHQPLSEPVRWRGLIAAVVATTTLFGPSFVPNPVPPPSVAGWHGQISQPTLWKGQHPATRGALSLHPLPVTVAEYRWQQPFSQPTLRKPTVQPDALSWAYFTPVVAETVTLDKWFAPFTQPTTTRKATVQPDAVTFHPFPFTVEAYRWQQPLSEPTRRQVRVQPDAPTWAYFTPAAAETVTVDKWLAPFSVPTRRGAVAQQDEQFRVDLPNTATAFRWFAPLSEPVRAKPKVQPDALSWAYFTPPAGTSGTDDVRFSASQTIVPYERTLLYQSIAQPVVFTTAEVVTVDKWFVSLAQPTLRKPTVYPAAFSWANFTPALSTGWIPALSEPVRPKPTVYPAAVTFHPLPVTVEAYRWQQPLSEPTRRKPTVQPDGLVFTYFVEAAELVTLDKWYQPFGVPPRLKLSAQQGVLAFHSFPVTVAEYRWQQPLAEPTRRVWPAAQQPALFFVGPDVAVNKWLVPFSEPTRRKPTVQPDALNWSYTTPALATDWIGPLAQPTYRIRLAEYPAVSWSTFTPTFFPGDATSLQVDWFNELQQPTRLPWSPSTFTFFWLAPSGEPGPTPVTVAPAQPGGYWYEKWEELARLSRRCKDDDECREAFAEAVEATQDVLATIEAGASLGRLRKAIARAAEARDLAYALRCCENIRKELTKLNAELMQARAEADEEEEEAIALLLLH